MTRSDASEGFTLIELVVATAIIGIAFVAVLGAMSTSIMTSVITRDAATSHTVLRSYAEAMKAVEWENCTDGTSYADDVDYTPPDDYAVTFVVEHFNGFDPEVPESELKDDDFVPTSQCDSTLDTGLQRITVAVQPPDDRAASPNVTILKRRGT